MEKDMVIRVPQRTNPMDTTYIIYSEKNNKIDTKLIPLVSEKNNNSFKVVSTACFSGLDYAIGKVENPNRLVYYLKKSFVKPDLTEKEIFDYIQICKKYKVLPRYINKYMVENLCPVIRFKEPNKSLLYIYLCALRMLQEYPSFPKVLMLLVNQYKLDFHVAWCIASEHCVSSTGHNFISIYPTYGVLNLSTKFIPLYWIYGFKKYMSNPDKYDSRRFTDNPTSTFFNTCYTIEKILLSSLKIKISDILNKDISEIINYTTESEIINFLKNLNITYK
jgi:hypothetical protein